MSTSADGVRVVLVDQTTAPEGDTSYTSTFRGAVVGGGVLSKTPETVTFQQPPGVFELACRHDDQSGTPVRVHVVDNDYNYREPQRPTEYGCRPGGALYPTIHHGGTAAEAVHAAIDWEADGYTYRVHQLDGGYWRVSGYGFVLDRDDDAWALGSVYKDESGRWTASPFQSAKSNRCRADTRRTDARRQANSLGDCRRHMVILVRVHQAQGRPQEAAAKGQAEQGRCRCARRAPFGPNGGPGDDRRLNRVR